MFTLTAIYSSCGEFSTLRQKGSPLLYIPGAADYSGCRIDEATHPRVRWDQFDQLLKILKYSKFRMWCGMVGVQDSGVTKVVLYHPSTTDSRHECPSRWSS